MEKNKHSSGKTPADIHLCEFLVDAHPFVLLHLSVKLPQRYTRAQAPEGFKRKVYLLACRKEHNRLCLPCPTQSTIRSMHGGFDVHADRRCKHLR
jgi:hypothetical protein